MAAPVECRALGYAYRARPAPALRDITLSLERGSWTLVAGLSGCGKSTLFQALAGLLNKTDGARREGAVLVDGRDPQTLRAAERAAQVGLVLQSADQQICTTTVESEVAFGLENLALGIAEIDARIDEALHFVGLSAERRRRVTELSGGQRQRLVLASVLAMRPQVLLLDEPLSQLDPAAAQQFLTVLDRLRNGGPTIVVAEHRVTPWLHRVDRLVIVQQGEITEILSRSDIAPLEPEASAPGVNPFRAAIEAATPMDLGAWGRGSQDNSIEAPDSGASVDDSEDCLDAPALSPPNRQVKCPSPRHPSQGIVELANVFFTYDRHQPPAIDVLQFSIHPGERIALLGANGSGKSTLLGLLGGVYAPQQGAIDFASNAAPAVALVPQNPDGLLFRRTVREELAFAPRCAGCGDAEIAARLADAAHRFHLEPHLNRPSLLLSQGERLRVALAATFTLHARLLVLDEPTTGQDPWHEAELMSALSGAVARGGPPEAMLFSTHDLLVAERYADRVIVLDRGSVAADDAPGPAIAAFRELLDRGAAP